jgi:DNA mismatch repair ATPase MutS
LHRYILAAAAPRALVLMDEVGTGTSPAEGSAIGGALLERLAGAGAYTRSRFSST